jgi:hypothetical protein
VSRPDPRDERRAERRERVVQSLLADGDCGALDGPIRAADGCCACRADRVDADTPPSPRADRPRTLPQDTP